MQKRHRSHQNVVNQPGQYYMPAMNQNYQQSQPQISQTVSQPQHVSQPSYRSGQNANMTPKQLGQVNSAHWSESTMRAANQTYQTDQQNFQTPQKNCLPASVPNHYQTNPAAQQSAQNLNSTQNYFTRPNTQNPYAQQNQTAMSSNSHNFPQHQYSTSHVHPTNVSQRTQPTSGQLQPSLSNLAQTISQNVSSQDRFLISYNHNDFEVQPSFYSGSNQQFHH